MKKKPWEKQESRLANLYDGKRQPGSGNGHYRKNDVVTRGYLFEAKQTDKTSIRIHLGDLLALGHNADIEGKTPVFAIEIQGHNYIMLREHEWASDGEVSDYD